MTYEKIVRQAFIHLQEDPDYPNFWDNSMSAGETSEMMMYAWEGLRDILSDTEINVTESTIPLYAQLQQQFDTETGEPILDPETGEPVFSKRNWLGYYTPPINRIQRIQKIFWKPQPTYIEETEEEVGYWSVGKHRELKIMSPEGMDKIDPLWRTRRTTSTPTHAILFSGNYDDMNMRQNVLRNNMKIKMYPTPTNIDENLQELLGSLSGLQTELDARRMSYQGGLMNDTGGDLVWGIDTDNDGERDDIVVNGSTNLGIMVQLLNGEASYERFGNIPIIRYVPDIDESIFTTLNDDGSVEWLNLDYLLPTSLQLALRDYLCYRAFFKEGEAIDDKKSKKWLDKYTDAVSKYRAENMVLKHDTVTSDSNFGFGNHNNRDELSGGSYGNYNNWY